MRSHLLEALTESRAVALLGARQVGKSTLVADLAATDHLARFVNLDDEATANEARADPAGFIAGISEPAVADEIQRVPELLLAIKRRLDNDRSRGQFLLTGSANILTLPTVADALPGRVEYLNLWPLSQGELRGCHETFIDACERTVELIGEAEESGHFDGDRTRSMLTPTEHESQHQPTAFAARFQKRDSEKAGIDHTEPLRLNRPGFVNRYRSYALPRGSTCRTITVSVPRS